jgi:hypothetical protein
MLIGFASASIFANSPATMPGLEVANARQVMPDFSISRHRARIAAPVRAPKAVEI